MIILVAQYTIKQGNRDAVVAALEKMGALVRAHEPGCTTYQISQSTTNDHFFLLYEGYVDQAAVDAHRNTPHFKEIILDTVIPMLEKREVAFYDLLIE